MITIPENELEEVAEKLAADPAAGNAALAALREEQPHLLAYLTAEHFEAFTHREQDFLLYLAMVLHRAARSVAGKPLPRVGPEQLTAAEEQNWARLATSDKRLFHERLDVFFEDTGQEDALAFIEDALSDDQDDWTTREGREAMFVSLKAVVDCLTA